MAQVNLGHVVGPGVPTGGTANQVLVKNGATNFDTSWKDASLLPAISDEATAREAADAALADGLAIIANGDTHAAVAAEQAVYVRSHSTLAPGLYWANSAIGTNAALSTSNLTADSQGGLNKLKGDIDSLNSNLTVVPVEMTVNSTYIGNDHHFAAFRIGNLLCIRGYGTITTEVPIDTWLFNLTIDGIVSGWAGILRPYSSTNCYSIYGSGKKVQCDRPKIPEGTYDITYVAFIQ